MPRFRVLLIAGCMIFALPLVVLAQNRAVAPDAPTARPADQTGHALTADAMFADCIAGANRNEIALAQLAMQTSSNEEVKKFADMLVKDHTQFLDKLRKVNPHIAAADNANPQATVRDGVILTRPEPGQNGERSAVQDRTDPNATARTRPNGRTAGPVDWYAIKDELNARCLASAKRELSGKQGHEFDACYLGLAIGSHMHEIDSMEVFSNHSSAEFKELLREGIETSQRHFEHAKKLMKDLNARPNRAAVSSSQR